MNTSAKRTRSRDAFTLIEVMIALGIFFMAVFTILALVSSTLRSARGLQQLELDISMAAAEIVKTNRFTEGGMEGNFGDAYRDYSWTADAYEVATNGLWQIDIVVQKRGAQKPVDSMSILVYSPQSQGRTFGGLGGGIR